MSMKEIHNILSNEFPILAMDVFGNTKQVCDGNLFVILFIFKTEQSIDVTSMTTGKAIV